jgi:hypothetical protein
MAHGPVFIPHYEHWPFIQGGAPAITPDVPFCAGRYPWSTVDLWERSVRGGVNMIADSGTAGGTHHTGRRRPFSVPRYRAVRPLCLLPSLRQALEG